MYWRNFIGKKPDAVKECGQTGHYTVGRFPIENQLHHDKDAKRRAWIVLWRVGIGIPDPMLSCVGYTRFANRANAVHAMKTWC